MSDYNLLNGYVGSKAPFVSPIKALFDSSCTKYVEPFCGGGAIFFSNYNGRYEKEWLNDQNVNIAVLYEVLRNKETRDIAIKALTEIEKPENIELAKEQFNKAKNMMVKNQTVCGRLDKQISLDKRLKLAVSTFLAYSQSFNCSANSYSAYKSNERYRNEVRRNIRNVMERMVTEPRVTCDDGLRIMKAMSKQAEVQMYIDWPYVGLYRNQNRLYQSEMADLYSHLEGARSIKNSKAAVVMSDYRSNKEGIPTIYDAVLTGEEWHCFKIADTYKQCMVVKNGEKKQKAVEFVWTNRVPEKAGLYLSLQDFKEKITLDQYWERIREAGVEEQLRADEILEYELTFRKVYDKSLYNEKVIDKAVQSTRNVKIKREIQMY